jgi:predicted DNA-binding transcriptional regulator AlpA
MSLPGIEPSRDKLGSRRLTAMLSVAVDVWIGNAVAVWSGCWGAVTRRAQETGLSRTSVYHHAQRVERAVINEQAGGVSYEALWADNG